MTANYQMLDVVPHDKPMSFLDRILSHSSTGLEAEVSITHDALFSEPAGIPSWVGIEYMGQAIAAFSGVCARERNEPIKIGFLVGTRRYQSNCSYFPYGVTLKVSVEEVTDSIIGLRVFECHITGDRVNAKANLNVFMPDNVEEFMQGDSA